MTSYEVQVSTMNRGSIKRLGAQAFKTISTHTNEDDASQAEDKAWKSNLYTRVQIEIKEQLNETST